MLSGSTGHAALLLPCLRFLLQRLLSLAILATTHTGLPVHSLCGADARRISTPAWQQLCASYRGGPELGPEDACPACLAALLDGIVAKEDTQARLCSVCCALCETVLCCV